MKGMLKDHPELPSYQDPILLALCRSNVDVNPRLSTQDKYRSVAQEWDGFIDARFVKPGSFKIVFETVVGTHVSEVQPVQRPLVGNTAVHKFKHMAEGEEVREEDTEGDAHRSKRTKTG